PATHLTILSGDIGVTGLRTDNSYHVVTIYQGDDNTVLDGFSIILGYGESASIGFPHEFGGGVLVASDMFWPLATPVISQCRFESNRAGFGGGLACVGNDWTVCIPRIKDCVFTGNRGEFYGGGMYKSGANHPQRAFTIERCTFEKNRCTRNGGGLAIYEPSDSVRIEKCKFVRDTAIEAGALLLWSGNQNVHYEIVECEFTANHVGSASGGAIEQLFPGFVPVEKIEIIVKKTRFRLNKSGIGGGLTSYALSDLALHRVQVEQCLFESNECQNGGAGILIQGGDRVYTEASVDRCWFLGNKTGAASVAGAFYYRGFGADLIRNKNTITNSVFMHNDGAIASLGGNPGITYTQVANCSFYNNGAIPFVKYWGVENNPVDLIMKMQILNSIIWEPQTEGIHRVFYNNDPANFSVNDYSIEHSLIYLPDCEYNGVDPCGMGMIYESWPDFIDPEFGNTLDIWLCSPAQNKGSNIVADTFGLAKDYWGNTRIIGDTVDMGAYEIQGSCISGVEEPLFSLPAFDMRVLQNPVQRKQPIDIELIAATPQTIKLVLSGSEGRVLWQGERNISPNYPARISIPSSESSGIYFVKAVDKNGRTVTKSLVVL
ncbi:MAG: choice-of-anchor Q domain-containing protein, partial [Saprospiraceae bacterium]|nr:choice-of-anchor Q domain-containing protein [Saprospiraceae bacterium]